MLILPNRRQWRSKPPYVASRVNKSHPLFPNLVWFSLFTAYEQADPNIASQSAQYCNDTAFNVSRIFNGEMITTAAGDRGYVSNTPTPYSANFTAIAWIKRNVASAETYCSIAAHHTTPSVASDWYWYIHSDNKIHVDIPWVAADVIVSSSTLAPGLRVGDWIQVAVTRTGSTGSWDWKLYINSVVDASVTASASNPAGNAETLAIEGIADSLANGGRCAMREFVLFNKELTAAEIGSFRNDPYPLLEPFRGANYATGSATASSANVIGANIPGQNYGY